MTIRPLRVVVVAYHGTEQLESCLATLEQRVAVVVVDNSSSPDVRAVAERQGAEYLDPGSNLGFAAGVNVGLRALLAGKPCDVLLLNPDAVVAPSALEHLARELHRIENERVGAISPRLVNEEGNEQRVLWPFPTPLRSWLDALGLGRLRAVPGFAVGSVLLLRWETLLEVGLFDERFFLYAEETDWQRRAALRGWTSRLCPDVVATHVGGGTSSDRLLREALFHAAQETYIRKWYGAAGWVPYRVAAGFGALLRSLILTGERRSEAARRTMLYLRGPRRCAPLARD
jgi:GT2 family glycosyltransferase